MTSTKAAAVAMLNTTGVNAGDKWKPGYETFFVQLKAANSDEDAIYATLDFIGVTDPDVRHAALVTYFETYFASTKSPRKPKTVHSRTAKVGGAFKSKFTKKPKA